MIDYDTQREIDELKKDVELLKAKLETLTKAVFKMHLSEKDYKEMFEDAKPTRDRLPGGFTL